MWGCVVECEGECGAVWWSVRESVGLCEGSAKCAWGMTNWPIGIANYSGTSL